MKRIFLLLPAVLLLAGCMRRAAYQRPAPPVPNAWPRAGQAPAPAAIDPAATNWRDFFADERLRSVIDLALNNNRDLRIAALNVEKVQALYRIQRAEQFPTVTASASGNIYRLPENMMIGGFRVPEAATIHQYTVNLGAASWELDLFGRVRSLKDAALERFLGSQQAQSAARIALIAGVANSYLALAADRENLRLSTQTLNAQQATYELIRQTRDAGLASDLEVRQAQSQVEAARVDIARYTSLSALDENYLAMLAGTPVPPELLPDGLSSAHAVKEIAAGLPSDVLLRRPDILTAEYELKAAYASIGAARAAYFPRIALTAGTGLMSSDLRNLFEAGAGTWSFAPQVALPLFDAGARKATLKAAEVDRDLAIAAYEKAIQSAFREVSDSLSLRADLQQQQQAQQTLLDALEETFRISEARYHAGIDSYLTVLIAQRALYSGQQGMVSLRLASQSNLVTLYKVLGGGA